MEAKTLLDEALAGTGPGDEIPAEGEAREKALLRLNSARTTIYDLIVGLEDDKLVRRGAALIMVLRHKYRTSLIGLMRTVMQSPRNFVALSAKSMERASALSMAKPSIEVVLAELAAARVLRRTPAYVAMTQHDQIDAMRKTCPVADIHFREAVVTTMTHSSSDTMTDIPFFSHLYGVPLRTEIFLKRCQLEEANRELYETCL